jgi:hypothetical protein
MRKVRNITVAVDPELYRQTRRIAVEYDSSVTEMVRYLLIAMPEALKAARFPGGRPQFGIAAARAQQIHPPQSPLPRADPPGNSQAQSVLERTSRSPSPAQIHQNPQNPPVPL